MATAMPWRISVQDEGTLWSKICGSMSYQPRLTSTSELHSWRYLVIYKVDKKKGGKILRSVDDAGQRIK
jgi:hypothetical protein